MSDQKNNHKEEVIAKFGKDYHADKYSFIMGIDIRFTDHLAQRFKDKIVLETCSGAGFTSISLAKYARHVYSIDIDRERLEMAKQNSQIAGVADGITFINGDVMSKDILGLIPGIDGAFIDPEWGKPDDENRCRFLHSVTKPPSDKIFNLIRTKTPNISIIQPPYVNKNEFAVLPVHECENLYLDGNHELYGLHFGNLAYLSGDSEFKIHN